MQNLFHNVRRAFLVALLLMATGSLSAQGALSGIVANPWGHFERRVSVELFPDVTHTIRISGIFTC